MHRETRLANYLLAALSSVALILMSLPLSGPVRSVKAVLSYAMNPPAYYGSKALDRLGNVPDNVRRLIVAEIENQALVEEMRRWGQLKAEAESLRQENARLRDALGLKSPPGWSGVWAHVMERDPQHWYHSMMVDAGSDKGVALNAAVLGRLGDSLVALGRIVETGPRSSKVLLLTDELSSAAAYLSSGSVEGLIQGQGGERLVMRYLPADAALSSGDSIYTSPTSATFPPDVLIGAVVSVYPRDPFLMSQAVELRAAAAASSFREVLILKPKTGEAVP